MPKMTLWIVALIFLMMLMISRPAYADYQEPSSSDPAPQSVSSSDQQNPGAGVAGAQAGTLDDWIMAEFAWWISYFVGWIFYLVAGMFNGVVDLVELVSYAICSLFGKSSPMEAVGVGAHGAGGVGGLSGFFAQLPVHSSLQVIAFFAQPIVHPQVLFPSLEALITLFLVAIVLKFVIWLLSMFWSSPA